MSRDYRTEFYDKDRERDREWGFRGLYSRLTDTEREHRGGISRRRSRSVSPGDRRIRSPRSDKYMIDDNILNEISKLPEPSELWDNNQFLESRHSAASLSPSLHREPNQSYGFNYHMHYSGAYDEVPSTASSSRLPRDSTPCNTLALPALPEPPSFDSEHQMTTAKVSNHSEKQQRKAILSQKKDDHMNKAALLKKELETLRDQRNELRGEGLRSPSPDTKRFLKENTKLQLEIQNKLKTINNVVELLNGIIDEEAPATHDSEETTKSRSPLSTQKFNYVYYDPEMHWCRVCNEFPPTAKDYLNHLHSPAHHKTAAQHMEAPWHSLTGVNEGFPSVPAAPTKRTPIRGLQFFVPQTGWYCKLCDQFIGDLHCASAHLKSVKHSKNYASFVQQNPHWETDWMSDRQRAFESGQSVAPTAVLDRTVALPTKPKAIEDKSSCTVQYTTHTVTVSKEEYNAKSIADKENRKKRESSVSSDSLSSDEGARKRTKSKKTKKVAPHDDTLEELISINDRKLLENIRSRMQRGIEERRRSSSRDRERVMEMQRKIRESERRGWRPRESEGSRDRRYDSPDHRDNRRDRRASSRERRASSRDRRASSRDRRGSSREKQASSRDRRGCSRDKRASSRDKRASSRDKRASSRDKRASSRDRYDESRSTRGDSQDRRDRSPARREGSRDRRDRSPAQQEGSRDRRDRSPARREGSRDRRERSPVRREGSRDRRDKSRSPDKPDIKKMIVIGKMPFYKSLAEEKKKEEQQKKEAAAARAERERLQYEEMQKMVPAIALSAALGASLPPPTPPPPVLTPILPSAPLLPAAQLPLHLSELPTDPKDFHKALEAMFPTDPQKCAEKVEQELMNQAMQEQPGLLGPVPSGLIGIPPFAPAMSLINPAMFPRAMFRAPPAPQAPRPSRAPGGRPSKPRYTQPQLNRTHNYSHAAQNVSRPNQRMETVDAKSKQLEELAMLGIDVSDVGV